MKSKHIYNQSHAELFKCIQEEIHEKLNFCRKRFNRIMISKCTVYMAMTVMTYISLYTITNPVLFVSSFIVFGMVSLLFAFNFAHDFSHNTIFKSKKLNHTCFIMLYTMVGAHAEAWKDRHVKSHHLAPNVEWYDSDLEITNLIRVVPGSTFKWFHRFQHWYAPFLYTTYSLFWVFIKDFKIFYAIGLATNSKTAGYRLSFWLQKIFYISYLIILPLFYSYQQWYIVLAAFIFMHLVQSLFLLFTFFMTHHVEGIFYPKTDTYGFIKASWLMNQIRSSNDFYPFSKVANFIFGGFNNHIAHHLFPHVHHIYYPDLNKILYGLLITNNIQPNQTTYLGGIKSHLSHLKRLGSR